MNVDTRADCIPVSYAVARRRGANVDANKLHPEDRAVHEWYRFVLSFPPHLVRDYLLRFGITEKHTVLDPFCGTGTVLVESKKLGLPSVGIEANPMAHFASRVKVDWTPDPDDLCRHASAIAQSAKADLARIGTPDDPLFDGAILNEAVELRALPEDSKALLLANSISPLPLHKAIVLLEHLDRLRDDRFHDHERLAFAKAAVLGFSNLQFGPEVGVGPPKVDAPVVSLWLAAVHSIAADLRRVRDHRDTPAIVRRGDARLVSPTLCPWPIDAVITSPPYPNEKDYTRTTRLESVLLGFIRNKADLRALKRELVRSNTRGVYVDDDDDAWVQSHVEIQEIADAIELRRRELGKTSGFERMYARVTRLYFGGMARHLAELRSVLRPGARLAYVVGDQASYLRVMIRTGQILARIAQSLGYEVEGIDLFRTRLATATRDQLREEIVVLRWNGTAPGKTAICTSTRDCKEID